VLPCLILALNARFLSYGCPPTQHEEHPLQRDRSITPKNIELEAKSLHSRFKLFFNTSKLCERSSLLEGQVTQFLAPACF
jgi:hypothetical protein